MHYLYAVLLPCLENRVRRRIFGSKRDEVAGEWRKFLSSENIRQMKSWRMRHVAHTGEDRSESAVLVGRQKERDHLKDQGVLGIRIGGGEWIHLARDSGRWRGVVNAIVNVWVVASHRYTK
jgi:hypothetical protein